VDVKAVKAKLKELKKSAPKSEECSILCEYIELTEKAKNYNKIVKELNAALDEACKAKYAELTIDEIKKLLISRKWYYTIFEGIKALYVTTSHEIAGRIAELAERYEDTLPSLESDVESYEAKVKAHLERMGFVW
jgi:type I restriction enzyme M protein